MKKTTAALALMLVLAATSASPQARNPKASGCAFQLVVTVLDLQDEAGTVTTEPTYLVRQVQPPGFFTDEAAAWFSARTIAAEGVRDGSTFYPANVIRKIWMARACS